MTGSGLLHDPVSGTTRRVTLDCDTRFQPVLRVVDSAGSSLDIALKDLSITQGGWRGDAITLVWKQEGQDWAITVDDPQTIANLTKQLPASLVSSIEGWKKQNRRSARWSKAALVIGTVVALLPLVLLVALFVMRDQIVDAVIARIPTSVDAQIGTRMYEDVAMSGKLVKDGPGVEALRVVSQRFVPHLPTQDFPFRFEVVNDASVNAYAAPGGLVVVHTGLLAKTASADQLAGVLGHEIVHVTRRHSLRQIIYKLGLSTAVRWLLGVPDSAADTIAGAAVNLSGLKFSRDQETDADAGGVDLLQKARLPAAGLHAFFKMLSENQGTVPALLSTHPADTDRLAALEKLVAARGSWNVEPLSIDWSAVRLDAEARVKKP
jgi:beta-barrel assembly-enhancing protease